MLCSWFDCFCKEFIFLVLVMCDWSKINRQFHFCSPTILSKLIPGEGYRVRAAIQIPGGLVSFAPNNSEFKPNGTGHRNETEKKSKIKVHQPNKHYRMHWILTPENRKAMNIGLLSYILKRRIPLRRHICFTRHFFISAFLSYQLLHWIFPFLVRKKMQK